MTDDIAANKRRARTLVAAVAVPVMVVVALVVALVAGPVIGLVLGLVVGGSAAGWLWRAGPGAVRRALAARPADPVSQARLLNLVDGLCIAAGVPAPEVLVVDDIAPNALSFGLDPRHASLVVTTGLLDRLTRVELEGVLARELARIKSHDIRPATVAVAVLRAVPVHPFAVRVRRAAVGAGTVAADASGVSLTRYPPGLAAALERLAPDAGTVRVGSAATAHLWLEPPTSGAPPDVHSPLDERVRALREL